MSLPAWFGAHFTKAVQKCAMPLRSAAQNPNVLPHSTLSRRPTRVWRNKSCTPKWVSRPSTTAVRVHRRVGRQSEQQAEDHFDQGQGSTWPAR